MRRGQWARVGVLEARQAAPADLWGALAPELRAQVTPAQLEEAARLAPDSLAGDTAARALWAFLACEEGEGVGGGIPNAQEVRHMAREGEA